MKHYEEKVIVTVVKRFGGARLICNKSSEPA